jgi:hypothetical protein
VPEASSAATVYTENFGSFETTTSTTSGAVTMSATSRVHALPEALLEFVLSEEFPGVFKLSAATTATATQQRTVNHCRLSDTLSLVSFVQRIAVSTSLARSKEPVLYSLLLDSSSTEQEKVRVAPTVVVLTPDDQEVAKVAPHTYMVALNQMLDMGSAPLRANFSGTITLVPSPFDTTQVTLTAVVAVESAFTADAKAFLSPLPSRTLSGLGQTSADLATKFLKHFISSVPGLYTRFARNDEIDEAILKHFEDVVVQSASQTTASENEFVGGMLLCDDLHSPDSRWFRKAGDEGDKVNYYQKDARGDSAWGLGVVTVDAPAHRVFGWLWCVNTPERINDQIDSEGIGAFRKSIDIPNSHSMILSFLVSLGGTFSERLFATYFCWRREESGEFLLAFADMSACPQRIHVKAMESLIKLDKRASAAIRGEVTGIYRIKPCTKNICRVTLVAQGSLRGKIPTALMNMRIKSTLGVVKLIRDKYERNGLDVDKELREAFPIPPRVSALTTEQREIYARCRGLEMNSVGRGWADVPYSTPLVKISMKHVPRQRGERSIALGRGESVIDCSIIEACAWLCAFCSRERMRVSNEEGNPARLLVKEFSSHDVVFATIKKLRYPLHPREFVIRHFAALDDGKNSHGDVVCAGESVSEKVDYGMKIKTVRGALRTFTRITPLNAAQCKIMTYQFVDTGGGILATVVNSAISRSLEAVNDLRVAFARDEEVDKQERDELARVIREEPQAYTADEDAQLASVKEKLSAAEGDGFENIDSPDPLVRMRSYWNEGGNTTVLEAITTMDALPEDCSAVDLTRMSRDKLKTHALKGGMQRSALRINDHSAVVQVVRDFRIGAFLPREWVMKIVWKWQTDGNTLIVACDNIEHPDFPRSAKFVRGGNTALWLYEKLREEPGSGVPQTKVTWTQCVDMGGSSPKVIVRMLSVKQMMGLSSQRKRLDKSLEIDAANRARIAEIIKNYTVTYSEDENRAVDEGLGRFVLFESEKTKKVDMATPMTVAKIASRGADGCLWGWSSTTVKATPEEVLSFTWDTFSRAYANADILEKVIDEEPNGHNKLVYLLTRTPKLFADRDFHRRAIWRKEEEGVFVTVTTSEDGGARLPLSGVVRGKFPSAMKITRLSDKETKIEYVINLDFGGIIPDLPPIRA